jgi:ATP phosphoribosyltransferase regulatory subunit
MNSKYLEFMLFDSDIDPIGLPNGVFFQGGNELDKIKDVTSKISRIFEKEGYQKVIPPAFEYYETFEKGSGPDIARRSFSFKDRDGKLLSLRYDMTTPIARMTAMKYENSHLPLKFYYWGDVFRDQPLHKGKLRQIQQLGIELIGSSEVAADAEVVSILAKSLKMLDPHFRIVIGDVRLYRYLLSQLILNEPQKEAIHACFNKKDSISLKQILKDAPGSEEVKTILTGLPKVVGNGAAFKKIAEEINPKFIIYMERLLHLLDLLPKDLAGHVVVDMGLIKDFNYYTSLTMEGYVEQAGHAIANGGRYDELFMSFGKNFPAIGFAIDIGSYHYTPIKDY